NPRIVPPQNVAATVTVEVVVDRRNQCQAHSCRAIIVERFRGSDQPPADSTLQGQRPASVGECRTRQGEAEIREAHISDDYAIADSQIADRVAVQTRRAIFESVVAEATCQNISA